MAKLSDKKLRKLQEEAEHREKIRQMGAKGNIRVVFMDPRDVLELLKFYRKPAPSRRR